MSDQSEPTDYDDQLLVGSDRWLFWIGIALLILAGLVLLALAFIYLGQFHADFLTFDGALGAAGAILGSIATTFAAIGSALLFIVSLRVQARELQHSIHELRKSVKAQKDAASSQQQHLELAKHEKEFNVIAATISEVRLHIEGIEHETVEGVKLHGYHAMQWIIDGWIDTFKSERLEDPGHIWLRDQLIGINPGVLLPHYASLEELLIKLTWLSSASVAKPLDSGDQRYLWARINPIVDYAKNALGQINRLNAHLEALANEKKPTDRIHELQPGLARCWSLVDELAKRVNELKRPVVGL
ncbi:MAG: hypothetical protein ABI432_16845 [Flavobacteriales bacterium]